MSRNASKGDIDFDFFDSEDEIDASERQSKNESHLSRETLQKHDRIHDNYNTRPGTYLTTVKSNSKSNSDVIKLNGEVRHKSSNSSGSEDDSFDKSRSDDGETTRTLSSHSTNISVKVPTAAVTKESDSESDASDTDSDNDCENSHRSSDIDRCNNNNPYKIVQSRSKKTEATTDFNSQRSEIVRPHTAKSRNHKNSWTSEGSSDGSRSTYSADTESSLSSNDSDASVTDVSPLHSPERVKKSQHNETVDRTESRKDRKKKSDGVRFVEVTPGYSIHGSDTKPQDTEARELSMLLKAVLEMDEHPTKTELDSLQKQMSRPSSGRSRRGGKRPQSGQLPHHRMNMSFSNDEVRRIDRENQRLLCRIVNNKPNVSAAQRSKPSHPMSHSAIRRMREQRRIESENMQILKRIEAAKASPAVRKENLSQHYQKQVQYLNQVGKSPHRPSSGRRTGSTYANKMAKASSMTSLNSDSSMRRGAMGSRPSSGKHSIVSDMGPPPTQSRPAWDEHWHAG